MRTGLKLEFDSTYLEPVLKIPNGMNKNQDPTG